jgi:hypothetical protein
MRWARTVLTPLLALLSGGAVGCVVSKSLSPPPAAAELEMRQRSPIDYPRPERDDVDPRCIAALDSADAAIARGDFDSPQADLALAAAACGPGHGVDWRRGWIARERERWDEAVMALVAEVSQAAPADPAGAQLLEAYTRAGWRARRRASRVGRDDKHAIRGGFSAVPNERLVALRCGGKPGRMIKVACGRRPPHCRYTYACRSGIRRLVIRSGWWDELGVP